MFRVTFILLFISRIISSEAQVIFDNYSSLYKWRQINTEKFRILFPESFSDQAEYAANLLDTLWTLETQTYGGKSPLKTTFIFRADNAISNGFATLGPRRSEIYINPPQDYKFIGTNDWLEKVLIHEFRHIIQFDQARQGFNKFVYYLFGENTLAAISFGSVPQWFWEGDAIVAETAFTRSGRGRIPAYSRMFKANLLDGKKFSYSKQYLGSYKDFVPSHYVLGTFYVPFVRKITNDKDVWNKITTRTFRNSMLPMMFTTSIKRQTGLNIRKTYDSMMNYLDMEWSLEVDKKDTYTSEYVDTHENKVYTEYKYPHPTANNKILALKSGLSHIDQFVLIDSLGNEKKLHTTGFLPNSGYIGKTARYLAWNEYNFDPRWRQRTFSVVKLFDLESGDISTIGMGKRYNGVSVSPDNKNIATVSVEDSYRQALNIISIDNHEVINSYPVPKEQLYAGLSFSPNGHLYLLRSESGYKTILEIDIKTGNSVNEYLKDSPFNIGYPNAAGDFILFVADIDGTDNIYAIHKNTRKVYKLTDSNSGAYNPVYENGIVYYNEQTSDGLEIFKFKLNENIKKPIEINRESGDNLLSKLYKTSLEHEGAVVVNDIVGKKKYHIEKYRQINGLLNPHSWGPFTDTNLKEIKAGIFSRDILSTTSLYGGYNYDILEQTGYWNASLSYQGLYPIIDVNYTNGDRSISLLDDEFKFQWKEQGGSVKLRVPLLLTRSKYRTSLEMAGSLNVNSVSQFTNNFGGSGRIINQNGNTYFFREYQSNGDLYFTGAELSFSNYLKQSHRDFIPRWGQTLNLNFSKSFSGDYDGGQVSAITRVYFPGILKHHSLNGYWAYQNKDMDFDRRDYLFRNQIPVPRGVSMGTYKQSYSMGVNYSFPIIHPDFQLGPVLYLKRLRSTLFYDYNYGKTKFDELNIFEQGTTQSTGIELRADFHVFRFAPEIRMGVRFSYDLNNDYNIQTIFPQLDL